jgi:hypothetical protein
VWYKARAIGPFYRPAGGRRLLPFYELRFVANGLAIKNISIPRSLALRLFPSIHDNGIERVDIDRPV